MNTYRSQSYYTVRSLVRWVFWTTVLFISIVVFGTLLNLRVEEKGPCDVTIESNFLWRPNATQIDIEACDHPDGVLLNSDWTWQWSR